MESMWNLRLLDYVPIKTRPEEIVKQQCEHLCRITNEKVFAKVSEYEVGTNDYIYEESPALTAYNSVQKSFGSQKVHIQDKLGDVGTKPEDMYFNYEFYLTSPATPKYRFRIMFFGYVSDQYPVTLVLNSDIANDIDESDRVVCDSEEEFIGYLQRMLNSTRVMSVIRALKTIADQNDATSN